MPLSPEEHKKRMGLYLQGYSDRQIADECGVGRQRVQAWRQRHGLSSSLRAAADVPPSRHKIRYNRVWQDEMIPLYKAGLTDKEIAKAIGCHFCTVGLWRRSNGLPHNRRTFPKACTECGAPFVAHTETAKSCPECRKIRGAIYFEVAHLRGRFAILCRTDPEEARRLAREIEEIEGRDFKEMAIDGILESTEPLDFPPEPKDEPEGQDCSVPPVPAPPIVISDEEVVADGPDVGE